MQFSCNNFERLAKGFSLGNIYKGLRPSMYLTNDYERTNTSSRIILLLFELFFEKQTRDNHFLYKSCSFLFLDVKSSQRMLNITAFVHVMLLKISAIVLNEKSTRRRSFDIQMYYCDEMMCIIMFQIA